MGYYGLGPGHQVQEALTPLEQALREASEQALDIMETLLRNVIQNPKEAKFRRIRLTNEKIAKTIGASASAIEALQHMGWVKEDECLVLPASEEIDFPRHVNKVLEAKGYLQKRARQAKTAERFGVESAPTPAPQAPAQQSLRDLRAQQNGKTPEAQPKAEVPAPATPENAPGNAAVAKKAPVKSANDFERRADKVEASKKAGDDAQDLRALRKQQYNEFSKDPNAWKGEAYSKPASTSAGASQGGGGWFDGWFGSSSSSSSNNKKPPPGGAGGGARIKGVGDLPKPVQRG